MEEIILSEANNREAFFRRIRYINLLYKDSPLTIKEIHKSLDKDDRQVSKELRELESKGYVLMDRKSVEGERGYRVFVSITEVGKRLYYEFEKEVSILPQDLEVEIRNDVISLINRFKRSKKEDTKSIIMEKIDRRITDLESSTYYKWDNETEIKEFYNHLLENHYNYSEKMRYEVFYFLKYAIKSGYYDEKMLELIKNIIEKETEIQNVNEKNKTLNDVLCILLRLLAYKPEFKDQPYKLLVRTIKSIRYYPESTISIFNYEGETINRIPKDIRKSLFNFLYDLSESNSTDKPQPIIDRLLRDL